MVRLALAFVTSMLALLLASPLIMLGIPIWITAFATRRLAARLERRSVDPSQTYVFDPSLGWRPRPNLDVQCVAKVDEVFHVVTGADCWPGRGTVEQSDVVVLGDSHAFGYGVDAERSLTNIHPEPRIKAIGAPGYNTVQELLALRELSARLGGKLVVWLVYPGNDMYDNLAPGSGGYRTPFVRESSDGWEIVTRHLKPEKWSVSRGRHGAQHAATLAGIHSPTFLARRAYEACAYILGEGADLCRAAGADLVVMTIPSPVVLEERELATLRSHAPHADGVDADYPERQIAQICAKLGVRFVPLKTVLTREHFKRHDDHLTEAGHRLVADTIRDLYRQARRAASTSLA